MSAQSRSETIGRQGVAGDRLLVLGASRTSLIYSLRESVTKKLKTSAALARHAPPGIRILDGTLVATVTPAGDVILLDLADAVEADRAAPTPRPVGEPGLPAPS
jgi:hypothetical protein